MAPEAQRMDAEAAEPSSPEPSGEEMSELPRTSTAAVPGFCLERLDLCASLSVEDRWWESPRRDSTAVLKDASAPVEASRSSTSCSSSKSGETEWSIADFDLSGSKLPLEESWWVPLAEDTMRLAEDMANHGCTLGLLSSPSRGSAGLDQLPGKMWRRFRRYKYFVLFISAVTLINGLFSFLLLECLLGTSKVCMFGGCQSPRYTPGTSLPYDRSTLNSTVPSGREYSGDAASVALSDADDDSFLNELSRDWSVSPHPSVPRAYTLSKKQGAHRALLVQDTCYLYMLGPSPLNRRPTGVWFDSDALQAVREGDVRGLLDARELEKLDLLQILGGQGSESGELVHKGVFARSTDFAKLQRRINRTVGDFVGPRGLTEYLAGSSATASRLLRAAPMASPSALGMVGGLESNMGSLSSNAVLLSEVANPPSGIWNAAVVFFPGDKKIHSQWSVGALKTAVGANASAVAGQRQGQPCCFRNALFVINERNPSTVEVDNFRQKSWALADSTAAFMKRSGHLLPAWHAGKAPPAFKLLNAIDSASEDIKLQMGLSSDITRTVSFFREVAASPNKFQVTILVDAIGPAGSEAKSTKIANLDAVLAMTRKVFPRLAVQTLSLSDSSFVEQVTAFKRTVLLIAPYGYVAGLAVFLPRGASMVELFPYNFRSDATLQSTKAAGVSYYRWENDAVANSKYEDNCMVKGNFQSLSAAECRRLRPCLFCVRDRVTTTVDRKEFRAVLLQAMKTVRSFLVEKHSHEVDSS